MRKVLSVDSEGNIHTTDDVDLDSSLNVIDKRGPEYQRIRLQFPMQVGHSWTFMRRTNPERGTDLNTVSSRWFPMKNSQ